MFYTMIYYSYKEVVNMFEKLVQACWDYYYNKNRGFNRWDVQDKLIQDFSVDSTTAHCAQLTWFEECKAKGLPWN